MAEARADGAIDLRVVTVAGVAAIVVAVAIAAFVGNPTLVLVTSYAVAWAAAIVLFGDDTFSRAVNSVIVSYVALIVFLCTLSPLPNSAIQGLPLTDRLNYYYIYYIGNGLSGVEENVESGYLLLVAIARLLMPFEVFLALVALGVLLVLLLLLRALRQERIVGAVALTLIAYFSFWSGALNITRQFVAAGLGFSAVVVLLRAGGLSSWLRTGLYLLLVCASFSVHSSGFIFGIFGPAYAIRKFGDRLLLFTWCGNIGIFILNILNASPLSMVPGLSDRLARYDSSQISDANLAAFQSAGVTTGNRIDWAVLLLSPMFAYAGAMFLKRKDASFADEREGVFLFALLYSALCVPFYLLSFLTFGDRIAFYSFLILPALLTALVTSTLGKELRYAVLTVVASACIAQVGLGLYGYTPKLWLTGLP